jgi:hypothetical protein
LTEELRTNDELRDFCQAVFDAVRPDLRGKVVTEATFIFEVVGTDMQPGVATVSTAGRRPWLRMGLAMAEYEDAAALADSLRSGGDLRDDYE